MSIIKGKLCPKIQLLLFFLLFIFVSAVLLKALLKNTSIHTHTWTTKQTYLMVTKRMIKIQIIMNYMGFWTNCSFSIFKNLYFCERTKFLVGMQKHWKIFWDFFFLVLAMVLKNIYWIVGSLIINGHCDEKKVLKLYMSVCKLQNCKHGCIG